MKQFVLAVMLLLVSFTQLHAEESGTTVDYPALYQEVCERIEKNFFDAAFVQEQFPALKTRYAAKLEGVTDSAEFAQLINAMLSELHSSHTYYLTPEDYEYYQLVSLFSGIPAVKELLHGKDDITYTTVGIITQVLEGKNFIVSVLAGSVAEKAGLLAGDEIIAVDDKAFQPVMSLQGKAGKDVRFSIRRTADAEAQEIKLVPVELSPKTEMLEAEKNSIKLIERDGKKIGYIHIYSYAGSEYHDALLDAISWGSLQHADALIIDLRYGLGGADPSYLNIFNTRVPVMTSWDQSGKQYDYDPQWRKPAAYLVNRFSRSGKEILAYGAKKYGLATVIGEKTAGAVVGGSPFPLSNGDLMYLAARNAEVDGEKLEGVGVSPDVEVPMDIRYSMGKDKQLDTAVEYFLKK